METKNFIKLMKYLESSRCDRYGDVRLHEVCAKVFKPI